MLPFRFDRLRPFSQSLASVFAEPPFQHASFHATTNTRRRLRGVQKSPQSPAPATPLPSRTRPARSAAQAKVDEQVKVNFFEQDEQNPSAKRRRVEDDQYMEGLAGEQEDFEQGLHALEKDIESFTIPKDATDDPANNFFTKEQRAAGTAALIRNLTENGGFPHRVQLPQDAPSASRVFVAKLNQCLDEASLDPGNMTARKNLWRFYERSKIYIPGFFELLPDAAWELIWTSQSEESETNPSRASHLRILGEDMVRAGRKLNETERFGRLEGLFLDGQQDKALQEWESAREAGDAGNPDFLEMGIRMHTYAGNLSRAEELLDVLFKLHSTRDSRILVPVIAASINNGTQENAERAWTLYNKMRERMADSMTMEDFDTITGHFLRNRRTDYALGVFRDMMLLGESRAAEPGSVLARVTKRFGELIKYSDDATEVDDLALRTMEYLPRKYQNKFFYGKWLKKLIGMGETEYAAQVIELMYERGIHPDAKHLNGLLGAWLRQDDNIEHRHRAEELAWSMVQKRLTQVRERKLARSPSSSVAEVSVLGNDEMRYRWANIQARRSRWEENLPANSSEVTVPSVTATITSDDSLPLFQTRNTPSATVETFCVLLQFYVRKGDSFLVSTFRNLLPQAELSMNSVIMNQLLYNVWEQSGHRKVWRLFEVISKRTSPDIETWICLWECMKTDLLGAGNLDVYTTDKAGFPTPRQMFQRMAAWITDAKPKEKEHALGDIENDTYNDIIRCFLMARDLEGAFVAMHFLTHNLDVWPSGKTARMLILQISQMNTERARRHRRVLRPGTADRDDKMARSTAVLDLVTQHRREKLKEETGMNFEQLSSHGQAEESLRTLLQFLHTLIKRQKAGLASPDHGIQQVAAEMLGNAKPFDVPRVLRLWRLEESSLPTD